MLLAHPGRVTRRVFVKLRASRLFSKQGKSSEQEAAAQRKLYDEWLQLHQDRPEILYHYTTAPGLLGILQAGRLWASNSRFMNDPTEITYATRLFRRVSLTEIEAYNSQRFRFESQGVENVRACVTNWLDEYEENARVYASCFCTSGDLLSQWRGYGAFGGGYAIGLASKYVGKTKLTLPPRETVLRKVIYDPQTQERLISRHVRALCELNFVGNMVGILGVLGLELFSWFFSECLNCFKDPAYAQEEEWRAICFGRDGPKILFQPKWRATAGHIVPYTELDFTRKSGEHKGKLPIKTIWYGPTLNPDATERALRLLLESCGYPVQLPHGQPVANSVAIQRSRIPFNG
jgi:DUF2971 family protein